MVQVIPMIRQKYPGTWSLVEKCRDYTNGGKVRHVFVKTFDHEPTLEEVQEGARKLFVAVLASEGLDIAYNISERHALMELMGPVKGPLSKDQVTKVLIFSRRPDLINAWHDHKLDRKNHKAMREVLAEQAPQSNPKKKVIPWDLRAALHHAMHRVHGAKARWDERRKEGLNNYQLGIAIAYEFGGESGGESYPEGEFRYHRKSLKFWLGTNLPVKNRKSTIEGRKLIFLVRDLIQIPTPEHMRETCKTCDKYQYSTCRHRKDVPELSNICPACYDYRPYKVRPTGTKAKLPVCKRNVKKSTGTTKLHSPGGAPPEESKLDLTAAQVEMFRSWKLTYLTSIDGIGNRTAKELKDAGYTYVSLAVLGPDKLGQRLSTGQRQYAGAMVEASKLAVNTVRQLAFACAAHHLPVVEGHGTFKDHQKYHNAYLAVALAMNGFDFSVLVPRRKWAKAQNSGTAYDSHLLDFVRGILQFFGPSYDHGTYVLAEQILEIKKTTIRKYIQGKSMPSWGKVDDIVKQTAEWLKLPEHKIICGCEYGPGELCFDGTGIEYDEDIEECPHPMGTCNWQEAN